MSVTEIQELTVPAEPAPSEQWDTLGQEQEAASFGMWMFLGTEMLFFSGMFLCYTVVRIYNSEGFLAAARETDLITGSTNTAVLLISSFTMIMAVQCGRAGLRGLTWKFLALTAALGFAFLCIKGYEYYVDLQHNLWPDQNLSVKERGAAIFFALYWIMTAVHGLHLSIGVVIVARFAWLIKRLTPLHEPDLVPIGLYWHFVDTVWIFLFPILYLPGRAG